MSLILILFKMISKSVYREPKISDMNKVEALIVLLLLLISIFLYLSGNEFIPNNFAFTVRYPWDIALILSFSVIPVIVMVRGQYKELYLTLLLIIALALSGIEMRLVLYTDFRIPFIVRLVFGVIYLIAFVKSFRANQSKK